MLINTEREVGRKKEEGREGEREGANQVAEPRPQRVQVCRVVLGH